MRTFSIAIVSCMAAAIAMSSVASAEEHKKNSEPVVVTNSQGNPVPVTGSVNITNVKLPITGTVNAQVTNIPTVSVNSMPPVTLGSGATVGIDPSVTVSTADVSARHIVRLAATVTLEEGIESSSASVTLLTGGGAFYSVPSGKLLVLNNIMVTADIPHGESPYILISFADPDAEFTVLPEMHVVLNNGTSTYYTGSITAPVYQTADERMSIGYQRLGQNGVAHLKVVLQGYLVDCGAGCSISE
jgi:hypothetical protein